MSALKHTINKIEWEICPKCKGLGQKRKKATKKALYNYNQAIENATKNKTPKESIKKPIGAFMPCKNCEGAGIIPSVNTVKPNTTQYPHVAIIGGGIGGTALAVACLHRGIPFTLFERDSYFNSRSQGYGLTLQQASKALKAFGIGKLEHGIVSTKHIVHNANGKILGEWGKRKWNPLTTPQNTKAEQKNKKTNIHIARQALRQELFNQIKNETYVKWDHKFVRFKHIGLNKTDVTFRVNDTEKTYTFNFIVGADGIRSSVRDTIINKAQFPLRFLNCMVILGICPLASLKHINSSLLDGKTVFQTANGTERMYMMPFNKTAIMWQFSFPYTEEDAILLSKNGPKALKKAVIKRANWHSPIPEIINKTLTTNISGYPVYDRPILKQKYLHKEENITLIGDAAHPMSPFKGQGANQALLDALELARHITISCHNPTVWQNKSLRHVMIQSFEKQMHKRSNSKVKASAQAVEILHSKNVLLEVNTPRGLLKNKITHE